MVGTLISHEAFKRYTQPVINGRQDATEINEGFDIVGLIDDNDEYNNVCEGIKASFEAHFAEVVRYVRVLEPHKAIYLDNETFDVADHAEATLDEWRGLLDQFQAQDKMFEHIPLNAEVGIFAGNNARIKELFMPSPKRCLEDIHRMLPRIAAELTTKLLAETSHAQERLQREPQDVAEFVDYSEFLRTTNERQKEFGERGGDINKLYALCSEYRVSVADSDMASVRMMESSLGQVAHLVAQCESSQEEKTNNFTGSIESSIETLRNKASELRTESEDKRLFDGETEMSEALELLESLTATFDALKADSIRFEQYQEILKVPVTKYDDVETLEINLRLKRNMWQGLDDFEKQVEAWKTAAFDTLNTEQM